MQITPVYAGLPGGGFLFFEGGGGSGTFVLKIIICIKKWNFTG